MHERYDKTAFMTLLNWFHQPYFPRIAQRGCCRANPDLMSESHSEPDVELVREGRNSRKESAHVGEEKGAREGRGDWGRGGPHPRPGRIKGPPAEGMPVGETDDSSHPKEWVQPQPQMDATPHPPGAAFWFCCPAIDPARA